MDLYPAKLDDQSLLINFVAYESKIENLNEVICNS